jgi:hypothetical protein
MGSKGRQPFVVFLKYRVGGADTVFQKKQNITLCETKRKKSCVE